jgi:hypothetical protein
MSNKSHRPLGIGQSTKTKPTSPETDTPYAEREFEFQDRLVDPSFDAWTTSEFIEEIKEFEDDLELPPEQTLFVTAGGFVRIVDSEGNCETYDPYLPENAMRVLRDWMGDSAASYYSDDDGDDSFN